MQKLLSLGIVFVVAGVSPALGVTADQKVTAVTVYPDRAWVTRSGSVKLAPGVQAVVFENLPPNLEEDSVRANASSEGHLKILGVEVRRDYKAATPSPASKQLQDDMQKLDDQMRGLTDEQRTLQRRNEFLDKVRDKVTSTATDSDGKGQPVSAQNIEGLLNLYGTEIGKISTRQREIEFSLRDLNRARGEKGNQLALLQTPVAPNTRSAIVTVDAGDAGAAALEVSYLIGGAGWQPQYDAYADPETRKVELTAYGVVRQTTGEDWNGVALTLSSARPSSAARLPELSPWTIDLATGTSLSLDDIKLETDVRQKVVQNSTSGFNGRANVVDQPSPAASPAADKEQAQVQVAEIRTLGPAATFVVPAKTSIPSDNQPHRSAISVQSLQGEWTYETAPKLMPGAFLKTRVTNSSGGPLLGGDINVFLGNNFVGKSRIGLIGLNASFDLFLGPDDNIKVTRTEGLRKEETGGMLTRLRVFKRSFTIVVENFKSTGVSMKVRDQLPVSRNEQVKVIVDKAEPAYKTPDTNTGELNWEFKLKPNEKQTLSVQYEIDVPANQSVAGM